MTDIENADQPETASNDAPAEADRVVEIAARAKAKAKARVAAEKAAKPTKAAKKATGKASKAAAKSSGNGPFSWQAFSLEIGGKIYRYPAGKGMKWVEEVCKGKRLQMVPGAKVEWPTHKSVLGKPSETQIRKGPKSGLPFAEYAESWPCLGYMIRNGWVIPTKG